MEDGIKAGIQAVELGTEERRLLARTDRDLGGARVGPYSFDDDVLAWVNRCCERALAGPDAIAFVDEIGKLELHRGGGLARLIPVLARPREQVTVAIVRDFLLEALVERLPNTAPRVVTVDVASRERAFDELGRLALCAGPTGAWRC
jgi:nucleoside-triphosphatase THEP1